jgi:hypothetical protein
MNASAAVTETLLVPHGGFGHVVANEDDERLYHRGESLGHQGDLPPDEQSHEDEQKRGQEHHHHVPGDGHVYRYSQNLEGRYLGQVYRGGQVIHPGQLHLGPVGDVVENHVPHLLAHVSRFGCVPR